MPPGPEIANVDLTAQIQSPGRRGVKLKNALVDRDGKEDGVRTARMLPFIQRDVDLSLDPRALDRML